IVVRPRNDGPSASPGGDARSRPSPNRGWQVHSAVPAAGTGKPGSNGRPRRTLPGGLRELGIQDESQSQHRLGRAVRGCWGGGWGGGCLGVLWLLFRFWGFWGG